jgi:hypothetical protein
MGAPQLEQMSMLSSVDVATAGDCREHATRPPGSVQVTKQVASTLKMVPIVEAVTVPFFSKLMDNGVFKGGETFDKAATTMLDELLRWAEALKPLRG